MDSLAPRERIGVIRTQAARTVMPTETFAHKRFGEMVDAIFCATTSKRQSEDLKISLE
jgi:hypothetical protein